MQKDEHYNPECVQCHATGFEKGGFISLNSTPEYRGVQCSACHGRMQGHMEIHGSGGEEHKEEGRLIHEDMERLCLECHTPKRDNDFDFERDKKRVH